jgi:peptidoglycan/xylan/chitin deacetylase (PgdA/CDA1 family)/CelD/BcsL family acetyltransferase involved in cellulose biosynthesis
MRVTEVRDPSEWQRLEPRWNRLLEASGAATTFLTWEWLTAWWTAYGREGDLRILVASDEEGLIRGIAPLRRDSVRRFGCTFEVLGFVGDGSNDSDYLDFIVERGFEDEVVRAWAGHLAGAFDRGVMLRLNEIPAASANVAALRALSRTPVLAEQAIECSTLSLPSGWNEYLGTLRPRFRTKIRSVLRNLESRPEVRFGFCETAPDLGRLLPTLFELHTRRWKHDGQPGVFGWDEKRRFYAELSPLLLDRGALRLSWLEWNGRLLACQYGFVHGTTYFHLQEGYEPASEHWNIGIGLRAWSIRTLLGAGIREYDFLAGVGRHKMDWGAGVKQSLRLVVGLPTYANLLYCRGPEWLQRTKDSVKEFVPQKVLARRDANARRPVVADPPSEHHGGARRAAALGYSRLGGPAVSRLIRRRFEASVSDDGRVVRSSWRRRRQPSARILYYHRVNDDRDLFFPATPLAAFDGQMRHIARHYKVVSLRALIDHLANGSAEPVVAITFDDGYRDNCENAFPILQRYGLPATIFLATGSLDSREPLWFEKLAATLKATTQEFVDVELDVPRRFWLRTDDERLRANGELFSLLRRLPEGDRAERLAHVLCALGSPSGAVRPDAMLTWDQVRHMKRHGIDFGGHTVTHPYLSRLPPDRVDWELVECRRRIEAELQSEVLHFAYPNGRAEDFAAANKDALRRAGYEAAVTTLWGMNYPTTDRLELRRGGAWEEDDALFAYKMDWYQLVNG